MSIIELDQSLETALSEYRRGAFQVRYAYTRSKDARQSNLRGEDYLVFRVEPDWLVFAVCDGVGSSFFGGLAAQILGERLLAWLADDENRAFLNSNPSMEIAISSLHIYLNQQIDSASQLITQKDIHGLPNQFVRNAYQEKRERHGSQSNFVCGLVDAKACRAWLFTLGDATLRAWKNETEYPLDLPRASEQSWSTKHGIIGDLHFRALTLNNANTLLAYSDGLNAVESRLVPQVLSGTLETYIDRLGADPKSDDISFIEIRILTESAFNADDITAQVRGTLPTPPIRPPISIPVPTVSAPQKLVWPWVLGLVLFSVGILIGFLSGHNLRDIVNLGSPTPTQTAVLRPSRTPAPSQTLTPTSGVTSSETSKFIETPDFTLTPNTTMMANEMSTLAPTQVYGRVQSNAGGAIIHEEPGGSAITTIQNGYLVEFLPDSPITLSNQTWVKVLIHTPTNNVEGWMLPDFIVTATPLP